MASASNLQNEGLSAIGMDNETLRIALGEAWENKDGKVTPIMSLYLFSGTGYSDSSPYLITSVEDWNGLVSNVYLGQNYSNAKFQLTDDISVTRMVGGQ